MTNEQAKKFANCLKNNYTIDFNDMTDFCDTVIKALEQQENKEQVRFLYCNSIDPQKFIEAMECQPLLFTQHIISEQQPSDDCVNREELLKAMDTCDKFGCSCHDIFRLDSDQLKDYVPYVKYEDMVNCVKSFPPVTPTQSWIPVSERLPEDRNIVLVTAYWHETYQVMMASYFGEGLWWCVPFNNCGDHMQKLNPKAWQPLPKPYKEKENRDGRV